MIFLVGAGSVTAIAIVMALIGFAAGWVAASIYFKKQINENPPINEDQIRELYRQTGKKLSESQVLRIMNSLKKHQK